MMSLIAPVVLNFIKRQFGGNADAAGLSNYLSGERSVLERSAPAGLLPVLGWRDWAMAPASATETARSVRTTPAAVSAISPPEERKDSSWYWLALPLLLLLLAGLFLMRGCNPAEGPVSSVPAIKEPTSAPTPTAPKPAVVTPAPVPKPAPETAPTEPRPVELVLRDNTKLMVWPDSIERQLVAFIEDTKKVPDEKNWFTFDRLDFETGSATLKPTSQERLKHVAAVLKAYPSVRIKIGGYTDNTGDPQKNLQLSDDRAKAAKQILVNLGIDGGRVEAEGYGQQYPVADNATEEGRQKNRRVDIRVTAK
ncbi:MAG: OmpA family protein [Candidatus Competibacteraceae bacterium]|nr:OmpA family protein [Candidatus Competibacteraceae bacterium]